MKKILLTAAVMMSAVCMQAQFAYDYLKAADNYYKKGDYYSAAQYYEKYLAGNKNVKDPGYDPYVIQAVNTQSKTAVSGKQEAVYKLAESYRQLNYYVKAEPAYKQAVEFDKKQYPLVDYRYATVLKAMKKYEESEKYFNEFLDGYKTDDVYSQSAKREIQDLRFIQKQTVKKDLGLYTVTKADSTINTAKGGTSAPVWMDDKTLLFTSGRPTAEKGKHTYVNHVYAISATDTGTATMEASKISIPQGADVHEGVVSLAPDGKTMFLTKWPMINGGDKATIWMSSKINDTAWGEPVLLDSTINAAGHSSKEPFVTTDGKYLLFSSDKAGGFGGYDLWYAPLTDGKPGTPVNMGAAINTTYNERAPYIHAASGTLVFANDGRVGMGGYDLFASKGTIGNFGAPENLGYPVNSEKDDIYFASKGDAKNMLASIVLSSDRASECCLDLFFIQKKRPVKHIAGIVVDCTNNMPVAGATVNIIDTITNKTLFTETTSATGSYAIVLDDYQPLKAVAAAPDYNSNSLQFNTPEDAEAEGMQNPVICLSKDLTKNIPEVGGSMVVENIYFDFDKAEPLETSIPAMDQLVAMMNANPTLVIALGGYTDDFGTDQYNQKLSDERAKNVMKYMISKGIDKKRLTAKGFGETMPVAPNANADGSDNPEARQKNRRTEFKVVSK